MIDGEVRGQSRKTSLGIVVPCFNEEEVLPETIRRLVELRRTLIDKGKISDSSKIYFVDDGSSDNTWRIIVDQAESGQPIVGIKLARNLGHQNALLAGLFTADANALVSLDADLQDDINAIERMVDLYRRGVDIVSGVRDVRDTDSRF